MKTRSRIADYFEALAKLHRDYAALCSLAADLGQPVPLFPAAPRIDVVSTTERRSKRAPMKRAKKQRISRSKPTQTNGSGNGRALPLFDGENTVSVPIDKLSRPQACLAILNFVGKPMTTEAVIEKARSIGLDWDQVSGGPSNAVHGALWRERMKGTVRKDRGKPWELVRPEVAPLLDLAAGMATLPTERIPPKMVAHARRQVMLQVLGTGRMTPIEILQAMRKQPDYEQMPRSAVREDLDALIVDGKAEKTGRGLYRGVVS